MSPDRRYGRCHGRPTPNLRTPWRAWAAASQSSRGNDGRRGPFDDHVLGVRDPALAALLADVAIARLAVDEPAHVDRVPEDRPHAALGPGRAANAAESGRRRDALPIELLRDRAHAEAASGVGLKNLLPHDRRHDRVDDQHNALAARLPAPGLERCRRAVASRDRTPVAVGRPATGRVPERGVRSVATAHDLRELLGVVMGEEALDALHQETGAAAVVGGRVVGVDDRDTSAPQRELMACGLVWLRAAKP